MNKKARPLASTEGKDVSYANLFNPLSPLMGGGDKYPRIIADMLPGSPRAAWLVSKAGAVGLLAAAIFGTARGVQHLSRMADMRDKDDPGNDMRSQLGTTFNPEMGKQASTTAIPLPGSISTENVTNAAVPIGAFILAAAMSWKGVDKIADNRRNRLLGEAIANKENTLRRLMTTRARIAKGTATPEEVQATLDSVNADDNYVKVASEDPHPYVRGAFTGLGLIVAALAAASGIGAYRYFKESNPNNIKFKAIERGLRDYATSKTGMTPITTIPRDADEYFAAIDGASSPAGDVYEQEDVRDMPEAMETHRPISVTL